MKPLFAATLLILTALGHAPADETPRGDLAKLQGRWTGMVGRSDNIPVVVEIKGQNVTATFTTPDGERRTLTGELRLNESATPKAVDWINFKTQGGDDLPDNLGIYELEGDRLKIYNGGRDKPRPTEFKENDEGASSLMLLTREGAGAPAAEGKK